MALLAPPFSAPACQFGVSEGAFLARQLVTEGREFSRHGAAGHINIGVTSVVNGGHPCGGLRSVHPIIGKTQQMSRGLLCNR